MFINLSDQFQTKEKEYASVGSASNGYYAGPLSNISTCYAPGKTSAVYWAEFINKDTFTPNGMYFAVPIAFYTTVSVDPFSGFPDGDCRLYRIYSGTNLKTFSERLTRFTLGGKNFISLSNNVCLRID